MGKRRGNAANDRARLREVVEAVSQELASGRTRSAIARDLLSLGFDAASARRLVSRVAGPSCRQRPVGERTRRLLVDLSLVTAGIGVVLACVKAGERGAPLFIAAVTVLVGVADAIAALVPRLRSA